MFDKIDKLEFEKKATVCCYLVPNGYPEQPSNSDVLS